MTTNEVAAAVVVVVGIDRNECFRRQFCSKTLRNPTLQQTTVGRWNPNGLPNRLKKKIMNESEKKR